MNLILTIARLLLGKKDLDQILGQFQKLDAQLDRYLDQASRAQFRISKRQSALRGKIAQLDDKNQAVLAGAERAVRVQQNVRKLTQ